MGSNISDYPLVIEAAISPVVANTGGQVLTNESIIEEAKACIAAGAGIIHYHQDFSLDTEGAIAQCIAVQKGILDAYPGTLIYPGYLGGATHDEQQQHIPAIHSAGVLTMFAFDPGFSTHARPDSSGLLTKSTTAGMDFAEATRFVARSRQYQVPCSLGMFEPGPLRWVKSFGAAGQFTPGTIVKLYFCGDYAWGLKDAGATFGLPPTKQALDICLSLLEGSGLPWIASILGGIMLESELPQYVLERGGHIRLGQEDPLRDIGMTNVEMVKAVVELASKVGRPVATASEALSVLSQKPDLVAAA